MLTTILVNSCAVFLAWLAGIKKKEYILIFAFAILFVFLALRYDFGNDYVGYYYIHQDLQGVKIDSFQGFCRIFYESFGKEMETGYVLLNTIIPNFYLLVALVSLLNCYAFYKIIQKYVPADYWWFSVFLYVFNPYLMLVHASAMRQSIAISIFMLSIRYLIDRKPLRYFLAISICCLFHYSAIVLLPLYFIIRTGNIGNTGRIIAGGATAAIFCFGGYIGDHYRIFWQDNIFDKYSVYLRGVETVKFGTGLGFLFLIFTFALVLIYINNPQEKNKVFTRIYALYFLVYAGGFIIQMVGRVGMYFAPAAVVSLPLIFSDIKHDLLKRSIVFSILVMSLYGFYVFFNDELWMKFFSYKTIFSL